MAYNGFCQETRTFITSSDLSTRQWHIVEQHANSVAGCDLASVGTGVGVVVNNPRAGEAASVVIEGEVRVRAGSGGLAIKDWVMAANTGYATKINSGAAGPLRFLGVAQTAASSGSLATVELQKFTLTASGGGQI